MHFLDKTEGFFFLIIINQNMIQILFFIKGIYPWAKDQS